MRHRKRTEKLGRTSAHRSAMLGSVVCALIKHRRIETTVAKAKAARRLAERMVTLAKDGSVAARRRAISKLRRPEIVEILFDEIGPQFANRQGGYTRMYRMGHRNGDSAEIALLEWTGLVFEVAEEEDEDLEEAEAASGE